MAGPRPFPVSLLALCCVFGGGVGDVATAQYAKTERRIHARSMRLRAALVEALRDPALPSARRAEVVEICAGMSRAQPLSALTRAVAVARGGGRQGSELQRAVGSMFAVAAPEVIDFDQFGEVYVTLRLARKVEGAQKLGFDVELVGADGKVRAVASLPEPLDLNAYLRVDASLKLSVRDPMGEPLPDGRYLLRIRPALDAASTSAKDLPLDVPLWVSRGYAERVNAHPFYLDPFHPQAASRAEVAASRIAEIAPDFDEAGERAAYLAAYYGVDRAFRGEPRLPGDDPVRDLERLGHISTNIAEGRPAFEGVYGRVTIGVAPDPDADLAAADGASEEGIAEAFLRSEYVRVAVDLPTPEESAAEGYRSRPLVLFLPGAASWNGGSDRPDAVRGEAPEWLRDQLARAGFAADRSMHVAVVEAPGRVKSPTRALAPVTAKLRRLLRMDADAPIVWVGEREGAYCVSRAILQTPDAAQGVVLVNGGSFSDGELHALGGKPILVVPSERHPAAATMLSLAERGGEQVRLVPGAEHRPWPIAVAMAASAIERFVQVLDGR